MSMMWASRSESKPLLVHFNDISFYYIVIFTHGCVLSRGHYGFVFEAVQKSTGRRVAVKRIDRSMCTSFRIIEEVIVSVVSRALRARSNAGLGFVTD